MPCLRSRVKHTLLSQLRLGIPPLKIEVGRFQDIDLENRICKMCNINIANKCHFLCECPCYQDCRETLLNHHGISAATPILDMFYLFMSSNETALAEYLCKAWVGLPILLMNCEIIMKCEICTCHYNKYIQYNT